MSGKEINKDKIKLSQSLNLSSFKDFLVNAFVVLASFAKGSGNGRRGRLFRRSFFLREWQNIAVIGLVIAGIISGIVTYAALNEAPPFGSSPNMVIWMLNADLVILLMLVATIASKLVGIWSGRKRDVAGSHLHVRLVYTFSILAAAPAIIMTVFSAYFFHFGVQTWFSQRIQTAIAESQAVAQAYLEEHKQVIRADTLAMANDLDRQSMMLIGNAGALEDVVQTQSMIRNLSEVIIFDSNGRVLARSGLTFTLEFEEVPKYALDQALLGDVVVMTGGNDDRVRALVKLNGFVDSYLFAGRMVDQKVLSHLNATKQASESYNNLEERYSSLQVTVNLIFVVVGFLLVLIAIWFGLILARQLVTPIRELIAASDRVRAGDMTARVGSFKNMEELDYLGRSFNRMTSQIEEQQSELIQANRQLDRRRRLTETVLEGVSAGIVGLDDKGVVNLANSSAARLLLREVSDMTGRPVSDIFPQITDLLDRAHDRPHKVTQAEIPFVLDDGSAKIFLVRIAIELIGEEEVGAILTFDDITELQSAQRKAAWADVARRIAHEIKNPLTPIQLSAERLKRKYLSQIKDDADVFSQCTDTIIKHVGDIGHMVNEFSSFARMPEPVMKEGKLLPLVKDVLVLQGQAHNDIEFQVHCDDKNIATKFDAHQIRQALTNLIQNAIDSIHGADDVSQKGRIDVVMGYYDDQIFISLADNGAGLPKDENISRLMEPYVTHKAKGTGLGLAIVKKIMEDHNGALSLGAPDWLKRDKNYSDLGGATVVLLMGNHSL
ncbi:MAG: two-component sensor histidine kinase [Micavibrio sp.]|nr:two-component sensor histidine kinase [Micavibrio sp.]